MKLLLLLLVSVTASAQVTKSVNFTFTNSNKACPATSPTSCASALTLEDITSLTPSIISQTISPAATSYSYTFSTPGTYTFALFVSGFDALGNPTQSSQATTTVTIPTPFTLSPPTGFTAKAQ